MKRTILFVFLLVGALKASAQSRWDGSTLTVGASATTSSGTYAPLWLTSNRYGVGSVGPTSAYSRITLERSMSHDADKTWQLGYGLDLVAAVHHERTLAVQQAYAMARWKRLTLTLGSRQQPMVTQNTELGSGELLWGINARPIPQARLDIDWFPFPGTNGWWQWKLHGSYGFMTDGSWQKSWSRPDERYATGTLYHEKALYWQFGHTDVLPFTYEIGLRMASQFGGTCYNVSTKRANDGQPTTYHNSVNLRAFIDALLCSGSDATDGSNPNSSGNNLGSYIMQLRYHGKAWQAKAYWERFFEDHSMLTVQYGIYDMLLGTEVSLPRNHVVSTAVVEFMSSTDQSGAVYHDGTANLPAAMAGRDNYYNHLNYAGWEHYGFSIGSPFITSPLYNAALENRPNRLRFYNNRVKAWHIGLTGDPSDEWHWRFLTSFTRNWGTYDFPLSDCYNQTYLLTEATYRPRWAKGWRGTLGFAFDHGDLIGNSTGVQVTVAKQLNLK